MRRPRRLAAVVVGVLVFVLVSVALARWLGAESTEREAIFDVVAAQASGDAERVLDELDPSCRRDAACAARVRATTRRVSRPGDVKLLNLRSDTAYALGDAEGTTRVAWTVLDSRTTIVQCFRVRREGNALSGHSVDVLAVSLPIGNEASCE